MAITVRSETTGTTSGDVGDVVTVSKPATIANGDTLVVIMGAGDDQPSIAAPAGWTQGDRSGSAVGNDRQIGIFYKYIPDTTAEPANYTFTLGLGDRGSWWIGALSDVSSSNPEDEPMSGNSVLVSNTATPTAPQITTATTNAFVLAGWATNFDNSQTMPGGSWATRANNIGLTPLALNVASQTFATPGLTGDVALANGTSTAETQCGQWAFRETKNRMLNICANG
jgi:hypothetical protein